MILVAGPYRSGTNDDPGLIARNVHAMTDMVLRLFRAGWSPNATPACASAALRKARTKWWRSRDPCRSRFISATKTSRPLSETFLRQ
jgi:hypothetical protein